MYKNWKVICEIPDPNFRWAMAMLDEDTAFGQQVRELLPQYFTDEQPAHPGPIPLSVLRHKAKQNATADGYPDESDLVTDRACWYYHIPTHGFGFAQPDPIPQELLPLRGTQQIGQVVTFRGKQVVVVQSDCREGEETVHIAPAECIAVDL